MLALNTDKSTIGLFQGNVGLKAKDFGCSVDLVAIRNLTRLRLRGDSEEPMVEPLSPMAPPPTRERRRLTAVLSGLMIRHKTGNFISPKDFQ